MLVLVTVLIALPVASQNQTEPAAARQPGTPQEVRFSSGTVTLAGLIRLPASPPPHRAVVLLAGSRPSARGDERLAAVARAFVAEGFAVLTTDSRGTGDSQGEFETASLEVLANDAVAAAAMLRQRADVRSEAVGFWGVSQGASWVGPLAAERAGAAFLVAVSGPLVSPEEHVHRFLSSRMRNAHGLADAIIEQATKARRAVWSYYATGQRYEAADTAVKALRKETWFASAGLPSVVTVASELGELPPATRTFLAQKNFDPLLHIRRLRCPLLAVYGARDTQLPVSDYATTLRGLQLRDGAAIAVELLPGLDHDLRPVAGTSAAPAGEDPYGMMAAWASAQIGAAGVPDRTSPD